MKKPGLFKILFFTAVLTAFSYGAARAEDPLCDTNLWTQMTQRANLLGQNETSIIENLVYKPDSVLEYTCFNRFINVSIYHMSYYMTPYYLKDIIQAGVTQYLYTNYGHTYLGGRLVASTAGTAPPAGSYVCNAMTWVWEAAKCMNFAQTEPQDSMYGLADFAGALDIRQTPSSCTGQFPSAYGETPVIGDTVTTRIAMTPTDCGQPVATGLTIDQPLNKGESRPVKFKEKVCSNPACNYTPTGEDSGTCGP